MSDGKIIIETSLDTKQIIKDIDKFKNSLGGINSSRFISQMEGLNNVLSETGKSLDEQKSKLAQLRTAFNNSTNVGQRNQLREQIRSTETTVTSLQSTFNELRSTINEVNTIDLDSARREITDLNGEFRTASVRVAESVNDITSNVDEIADHARETASDVKNTFEKIGESIKEAGEKASETGEKLSEGITKPVLAAGAALLAIGVTTDEALSKIQGQLGTTAEETDKLKKVALDVYQNGYGESLEAVSSGLVSLQQNLKTTKNMTDETKESLLTNTMTMQDLFEVDPKELTNALSVMQNSGFDDDIMHAMDVLTYGFQNGANYSDELLDTMKEYAPQFAKLGVSSEQAMNMIIEGAQNGAWNVDKIGDSVKEFAIRAIDGSKTTIEGFQEIGLNADEMAQKFGQGGEVANTAFKQVLIGLASLKDPVKQNTVGVNLFGTQWEDMGKAAVISLGNAKDSIENINGTTDRAAANNTSAANQFEQALRKTRVALLPLATEVLNMAKDVLPELSEGIKGISTFLGSMDSETKQAAIKMALLAAGIGPVTKAIGTITTLGGRFITFLGGLGTATTAAGGGFKGLLVALTGIGPVGWGALAAITALGIGIAGVATHSELMSKSIDTSAESLSTWEQIVNSLTGNTIKSKAELQNLGLVYKDFGDNIGDSFKSKVEASTKAIGEFSLFLSNIDVDGVLTDSETSEFNNRVDTMVDGAIKTIQGRQQDVQKAMTSMFMGDDNVLDENEKLVLASLSSQSDEQMRQVTQDQADIHKIYTEAIKARGHLTDEEKKVIKDRYIEIAQIELAASQEAKTQQEQSYLKHDFTNRANNLSAADGSTLLKDQRKKLDEQQIKDKTNYDVNIDTLKAALATQTGEVAKATQAEIDKFTEKKNKVAELEQQQWEECIATIERENPNLVGVYNKYNGDILTEADKKKEATLQTYKDTFSNMNDITETGMYSLYNVSTGKFNDVYVTVDKTTKQVTGAWSTCMVGSGGYTKQMADDAQQSALAINLSFSKVTQGLDSATSLYQDAAGNMVSNTGQIIGKLGELQYASDGTAYKIMNLNGTEIKVPVNKDGTITDLETIRKAVANIPTSKKVNVDIVYTNDEFSNTQNEKNYTRAMRKAAQENYTGTNSLKTGLSYVDEHGYETANNDNVKMLGNGLAYLIGNHYSGGDGINPHMTTVNEMNRDITDKVGSTVGKIINVLIGAMGSQNSSLNQVANNTSELIKTSEKGNLLNEKLATDMVNNWSSKSGSFTGLQNDIITANTNKDKASKMKIEDNSNYAKINQEVDTLNYQLEELKNKSEDLADSIGENASEAAKKSVEAQQKEIEKQEKVLNKKKNVAEKEKEIAREVAENEINYAKESADQQSKIAEEKKNKLTKIAEATATAIKSKLESEKSAALNNISSKLASEENASSKKLSSMEKEYNSELSYIEKSTKAKTEAIDTETKARTAAIDSEIAALEEKAKIESRDDERKAANDNINMLSTKRDNTKSQADKDSLTLQINKSQKELNDKENTWNTEDAKAALEEEKAYLEERAATEKSALEEEVASKKESLQEEYENQKASEEERIASVKESYAKQKEETESYYNKLLETDSINAQTRYMLMQGDQQALVDLLNSYAPGWQDAGQSLVDSLLNGLNSKKQSVQDAVSEMMGYINRGSSSALAPPPHAYNTGTGKYEGYATGTPYNPRAGLYKVDEKGFETTNNGSVAYISKGASINNNMQSKKFLSDEISRQVALMRESVVQSQAEMQAQLISNVTNANNSKTYNDHGQINFNVENFINHDTKSDIGQISNELGSYRQEQRKF